MMVHCITRTASCYKTTHNNIAIKWKTKLYFGKKKNRWKTNCLVVVVVVVFVLGMYYLVRLHGTERRHNSVVVIDVVVVALRLQ